MRDQTFFSARNQPAGSTVVAWALPDLIARILVAVSAPTAMQQYPGRSRPPRSAETIVIIRSWVSPALRMATFLLFGRGAFDARIGDQVERNFFRLKIDAFQRCALDRGAHAAAAGAAEINAAAEQGGIETVRR